MTKQDTDRFARLMAMVGATFGEELNPLRVEAYFLALGDLPLEALERAGASLMRESRFFPRPADFRQLIEGSVEDKAQRAWVLLEEACRVSGDQSLFCEDQTLAQAMYATFGSWVNCYEMVVRLSPEMEASKRKEFCYNYKLARTSPNPADMRYSPGRMEMANRENVGWRQRWLEEGRTRFGNGVVVIAGDSVQVIGASFDTETAQLSAEAWRQLTEGTALVKPS